MFPHVRNGSSKAQRALAGGATWLLGALLGWGAVLAIETLRHLAVAASVRGELAYLGRLATLQLLAFSAVPLALHALRWLIDRPWRQSAPLRDVRGALVTTFVVGALALWPAWSQAAFLTAGAAISESPYSAPLRFLACGSFVLGYALLWYWHLLGTALRTREGARWPRLRAALWYGTGLGALAGLYYALAFRLSAYAYFAEFLVPPAWFIASTLGYRALRALPWRTATAVTTAIALSTALWLLGTLAPEDMARARSNYVRRGKVAALGDLMVHPPYPDLARLNALPAQPIECTPQPTTRALRPLALAAERRRNVILISVDALRLDALGWTHRGAPLLPALRAFAARGLRFERAVTTYPATLLAVAGALTGLGPGDVLFSPSVPDNIFTLTRTRFDRQLVSLSNSKWFLKPVIGQLFIQGATAARHSNASKQTAWLIDELASARANNERVLAWVHYFEPHHEYKRHDGFDYGQHARGRYMSELAYVDHQLGKLFAFLQRANYFEDSLVIVFSDHGEALGELDYEGHHVHLNSWIADIPLIVRAPALAPGASSALADVTDVAVTVLHYLGLAVPWQARGVSLLAADAERRGRVSFAEAFPIRGGELFTLAARHVKTLDDFRQRMERVHRGAKDYQPKVSAVSADHRLIVNRVTGLEEFYDRRRDRNELHDLSFLRTPEHRALRRRLTEWSAEQARLLYCRVREQPAAPDPGTD